MSVNNEVFDPGQRFYSYEDYINKCHTHPLNDVDVLPKGVARWVTEVYTAAKEVLLNLGTQDIDRRGLFNISLAVHRMKKHEGVNVGKDKAARLVAYVYLYRRGLKTDIADDMGRLVLRLKKYIDIDRWRFIKIAIQRIAQNDVTLHKILGTAVKWIVSRKVSASITTILDCACKIASYLYPDRYVFYKMVQSYRAGNLYVNKYNVLKKLESLGVKAFKPGYGIEKKVYIPESLCKELEKSKIVIPSHVICYSRAISVDA